MIERFADPERGGFFSTADDHEALVARRKDLEDAPIPSGAVGGRLRAAAAGRADRRGALRGRGARRHSACCTRSRPQHPAAFGHLLQALDFHLAPVREVALVGDDARAARARRARGVPPAPRAGRRRRRDGASRCSRAASRSTARAAAYVCERFACQAPGDRAGRAARAARRVRRPYPYGVTAAVKSAPGMPAAHRRRRHAAPSGSSSPSGSLAVVAIARRQPAGQVRRRREERVDLVPARRRRVDEGADEITSSFQGGEPAPVVIVYRREGGLTARRPGADRERPPGAQRGSTPDVLAAAVRRAAVLVRATARRAADRAGTDHRRRRGRRRSSTRSTTIRERVSDPRRRAARSRSPGRPASPPTRSRSSRASTARCCSPPAAARLRPADPHLPQPDLLVWIPLFAVVFAESSRARVGYGLTEAGRDRQRPVVVDPLRPRPRRGHRLRAAARRPLPRGAAPPRGQARGDARSPCARAGPAIIASGLTVIAALLCLTLAKVNGTAGLGPIGRARHRRGDARDAHPAAGAAGHLGPAARSGRSGHGFPHFGDTGADETHGAWRRVGERVARAPAARRGSATDGAAARARAAAC